MNPPNHDPSVFHEPDRQKPSPDRKEEQGKSLEKEPALQGKGESAPEREAVDQAAWDEPAILASGKKPPQEALQYASWLQDQISRTSYGKSIGIFLLVILLGGPLAILGASVSTEQLAFGFLGPVVFGPAVEEILKISAALYIVERRPFLFRSSFQILAAVAGSALFFSVIENLIYLNIYIDDPSDLLVRWRWTVCPPLHVGASLIAGLGLLRIWKETRKNFTPPDLSRGFPLVVAAVMLHGGYNALAIVVEQMFEPF